MKLLWSATNTPNSTMHGREFSQRRPACRPLARTRSPVCQRKWKTNAVISDVDVALGSLRDANE